MRDTPVPKTALDRATRFKIYDPDTGYDGTASLEDFGLVTAVTGLGGGGIGIARIVSLTQAQYDALATKDPATLYVIVEG